MATHGGDDERFESSFLERANRSLDNGAVVCNSPATACHCGRLSPSDILLQAQPIHLKGQLPGDILDDRSLEFLPDPKHSGEVHYALHLTPIQRGEMNGSTFTNLEIFGEHDVFTILFTGN